MLKFTETTSTKLLLKISLHTRTLSLDKDDYETTNE